jgi:hypothetical protein
MKTIKKILRCSFCPAMVPILFVSFATGAYGATLRIKPEKLKAAKNIQSDFRLPFAVGSNAQNVNFYYLLKLPRGTKFKGLEYQHGGLALSDTSVSIMRAKADASPALQWILQGESTQDTVNPMDMVWVEADFLPGAVRRVKKGWTYFVFVECGENASIVGDIKVFYQ